MVIVETNSWSGLIWLKVDYLDVADGFVGLRHPDRLGRVFIRQHLSAPEVISSEDDPVNEVLRLAGTWNWAPKQNAQQSRHVHLKSNIKEYLNIFTIFKAGKRSSFLCFL